MRNRRFERNALALLLAGCALLLTLSTGPTHEPDQAVAQPATSPDYAMMVPVASRSFMDMMHSAHR